jgi:hypothetical protein
VDDALPPADDANPAALDSGVMMPMAAYLDTDEREAASLNSAAAFVGWNAISIGSAGGGRSAFKPPA